MSNSIKVLSQNADGVIYVENEGGVIFGIVDALTKIEHKMNKTSSLYHQGYFSKSTYDIDSSSKDIRTDDSSLNDKGKIAWMDMNHSVVIIGWGVDKKTE